MVDTIREVKGRRSHVGLEWKVMEKEEETETEEEEKEEKEKEEEQGDIISN